MDDASVSRLVRNTLSTLGLRGVTWILALVSVPVLIDAIGEEGFGLIILVNTLLGYLSLLGVGLPSGTVKYVAEYDAKDERASMHQVIDTSLTFFAGMGLIAAMALVALVLGDGLDWFDVSEAARDEAETTVLIAAGVAVFNWATNALSGALEGLQLYHRRNVIQGGCSVISYGLAIGAALAGLGIVGVFIGQQLGTLVRSLLLLRAVKRAVPDWRPLRFGFHRQTFREMMSLSVWIFVRQIAVIVVYRADHAILGAAVSVASIAVYEIVMRPAKVIAELGSYFTSAMMPAVSATDAREGRAAVQRFALLAGRYANAFSAPLVLVGTVLCGPFIQLWVGHGYDDLLWLAQIACGARFWMQSNAVLTPVFYGTGRVRALALISITIAALNLGLSIWWVHVWGLVGVIVATFVAFAVAVPLQYLLVFPLVPLSRSEYLLQAVLRPLAPHVLAAGALAATWEVFQSIDRWWQLGVAAVGLGGALTTLTWFTNVRPEHRRWIRDKVASKLGALRRRRQAR